MDKRGTKDNIIYIHIQVNLHAFMHEFNHMQIIFSKQYNTLERFIIEIVLHAAETLQSLNLMGKTGILWNSFCGDMQQK